MSDDKLAEQIAEALGFADKIINRARKTASKLRNHKRVGLAVIHDGDSFRSFLIAVRKRGQHTVLYEGCEDTIMGSILNVVERVDEENELRSGTWN